MTGDTDFSEWCVLELFGHRRLAGHVREQEIAGAAFLRIDVPGDGDEGVAATQFYAPAAVFSVTPTTEEIARAVAKSSRPTPVHRWELPALAGAPALVDDVPDDPQEPAWDDDE